MIKHFCDSCGEHINKCNMDKYQVKIELRCLAHDYHTGLYHKELCEVCQNKLMHCIRAVLPGFGDKVQ